MKIRPKRFSGGKTGWEVDLGRVGGKRVQRYFLTKEAADAFLAQAGRESKSSGDLGLALSVGDKAGFAEAKARLGVVGATIGQAVDYYLENHKPVKELIDLGTLLDRCVLDMELRAVASNTVSTFTCACLSFVETRRSRALAAITREEIREWIYGNQWQPKTQRGYLGALSGLLTWAVEEGYLARTPLVKTARNKPSIKLPKLTKKEPAIFTIEQLQRLFTTALTKQETGLNRANGRMEPMPVYRRLIGFLALATFCGVRPFELTRLEVSSLDLQARHVPLDAAVTKTNDRRVLELSPNCVAWLKLWRAEFPDYTHVAPPSWDRLMKGLRQAAGLRPWPHDVLRHCFASYFHATHGDKAKLQNQMGHSESEDTLDKHYRAVRMPDGKPVTKKEAAAFWKITPPKMR